MTAVSEILDGTRSVLSEFWNWLTGAWNASSQGGTFRVVIGVAAALLIVSVVL